MHIPQLMVIGVVPIGCAVAPAATACGGGHDGGW